MIKTLEDFYKQAQEAANQISNFAKEYKLNEIASADHICYKCDSQETFKHIRSLFEHGASEHIFQSIISKRRIANIKFSPAIESALGPISFLELSDQNQMVHKSTNLNISKFIQPNFPTKTF